LFFAYCAKLPVGRLISDEVDADAAIYF